MLNLNDLQGLFLSVEGNEFSGKTTLINNLIKQMKSLNIKITKEPGATDRGKLLREWVTNPQGAFTNNQNLRAMGFAMDRALHINEIIYPHLEKGSVVITDRYIDSSYVLQGIIQGIPIDEINFCNCYANNITNINNILPFKTIYVDITEETAIERSKKRKDNNLLDEEFMKRFSDIRNAYLELARMNPNRYIVINGNHDQETVQKEFNELVMSLVKENNK